VLSKETNTAAIILAALIVLIKIFPDLYHAAETYFLSWIRRSVKYPSHASLFRQNRYGVWPAGEINYSGY